jgi:hypothetical protein
MTEQIRDPHFALENKKLILLKSVGDVGEETQVEEKQGASGGL